MINPAWEGGSLWARAAKPFMLVIMSGLGSPVL
jgi:hypothetical protein